MCEQGRELRTDARRRATHLVSVLDRRKVGGKSLDDVSYEVQRDVIQAVDVPVRNQLPVEHVEGQLREILKKGRRRV